MTHLRRSLALVFVAAGAAFAGPIGCGLFAPPPMPQMPDIPAPPEPPKPPDAKPPEVPKLQSPIPIDNTGNCCFRHNEAADQCSGATRCCNAKFEVDECEAKGGFWFHTPEDCAGAC
ncbi:MAG: hypothetical protein IPK82_12735 [Polyangiaceae bacterium]|nr:hypothetical protein [Polyangiaceae bacterium]